MAKAKRQTISFIVEITPDNSPEHLFDGTAIGGDVFRMDSLLESNIDINRRVVNADGQTALHISAFENDPEMACLLLRHGADAGLRDEDGQTALDIAKKYCYKEVVSILEKVKD